MAKVNNVKKFEFSETALNFVRRNILEMIELEFSRDGYTDLMCENDRQICDLKTFADKKEIFDVCKHFGLNLVDWVTIFLAEADPDFSHFLINEPLVRELILKQHANYADERISEYEEQVSEGIVEPCVSIFYPTLTRLVPF